MSHLQPEKKTDYKHEKDLKLTYHTVEAGGSTSHLYRIQIDFELILPTVPKLPASKRRKNIVILQPNNYVSIYVHIHAVCIQLK